MSSRNARAHAPAAARPRAQSMAAGGSFIPTVSVDGLKVTITITPSCGGTLSGTITGPSGTKPMTPVAGSETNKVEVTVDGPGTYTATVKCGDQSVDVQVEVPGGENARSIALYAPPHATVTVRHTGQHVTAHFDLTPPKRTHPKKR